MNVDQALTRCPFLHNLAEREGREYASSIAINPLRKATGDDAVRRPLLEESTDYAATFALFHGPQGAFPLGKAAAQSAASAVQHAAASPGSFVDTTTTPRPHALFPATPTAARPCPFAVEHNGSVPLHAAIVHEQPVGQRSSVRHPLASAPLATLSLGGMPDFGDLLRKLQLSRQPKPSKPSARKPPGPSTRSDISKPPGATAGASMSSSSAAPTGPAFSSSTGGSGASAAAGGTCPMRAWLGPAAGLIFNKAGHVTCPEPIIRARAMLASTQAVKTLRPQTLPIKLVAVGAIAAATNVPCGMWREHTEKFSFQWFVAVHASIPFIAMLRKAVIMPKLAIVCTIAAAIAGQAMGARIERERLAAAARAAPSLEAGPALAPPLLAVPGVDGAAAAANGGAAARRFKTSGAGKPAKRESTVGAADAAARRVLNSRSQALQPAACGSSVSSSSLGMEYGGADWRMDRLGQGVSFKHMLLLHDAAAY